MQVSKLQPRKPDENAVIVAEESYNTTKQFKAYFDIVPANHTVALDADNSQIKHANNLDNTLARAARQIIALCEVNKVVGANGNVIAEVTFGEAYDIPSDQVFKDGE